VTAPDTTQPCRVCTRPLFDHFLGQLVQCADRDSVVRADQAYAQVGGRDGLVARRRVLVESLVVPPPLELAP
jgi:hypothetical protein